MECICKIRMEILWKYNIMWSDVKRWVEIFVVVFFSDEDYFEWNYGNLVFFVVVILIIIGKIL